ncbi:MAG: trehalose-phosphatase, partial [bacterium]|nr:trehalose-phosphatase [bacterium]
QYQQMKKEIDEYIGKINGRFGNAGWMPLIYQYRSITFEYLTALYSISDIGLITPLRDGMNQVAKEYIASQSLEDGVLILSEMAGASKELGEAIIINPNHIESIADALNQALNMPKEEVIKRNQTMQLRIKRYDVIKWAEEFMRSLMDIREKQKKFSAKQINNNIRSQLISDYKKSGNRLILLDYDGTLVPFKDHPQKAVPSEDLIRILKDLCASSGNDVVIVSGRDRISLQNWLSGIPVGLVAEHGAWIKDKAEDWSMIKPLTDDWKNQIRPILDVYTDRLPGSFLEEKEFALVWHYRRSDPEMALQRQRELVDELVQFTANIDIQILQGNKVIEVRNAGVNKGIASLYWKDKRPYDFILAVGDDWTDEDMFKILPSTAYTFRVGISPSYARFNLMNNQEVLKLLSELKE